MNKENIVLEDLNKDQLANLIEQAKKQTKTIKENEREATKAAGVTYVNNWKTETMSLSKIVTYTTKGAGKVDVIDYINKLNVHSKLKVTISAITVKFVLSHTPVLNLFLPTGEARQYFNANVVKSAINRRSRNLPIIDRQMEIKKLRKELKLTKADIKNIKADLLNTEGEFSESDLIDLTNELNRAENKVKRYTNIIAASVNKYGLK